MSLKEQNVEKQSLSPTKFFSSKSQNINLDNKTNAKKIKKNPGTPQYLGLKYFYGSSSSSKQAEKLKSRKMREE